MTNNPLGIDSTSYSGALMIQRQMCEGAEATLGQASSTFDQRMYATVEKIIYGTADTYFVTREMTELALVASKTMPPQNLHEDDWPSPSGFLIYEPGLTGGLPGVITVDGVPVNEKLVIGFAWAATSSERAATVGRKGGVAVLPLGRVMDSNGNKKVITLVDVNEPPYWNIGEPPNYDRLQLAPLVLTTWTVMQQRLAVKEAVPAQRAERRRCARLGLPQNVVVVRVRQHERPDTDGEEAGVEWSHRWLVSGHWRNQPHGPKRARRRQQWIPGYIKGPDDKPLIVKDRVTAWVR